MANQRLAFLAMCLLALFWATMRLGVEPVEAARISDVRGTKHNLSAVADGTTYTRADGTTGTVPGTGTIPGTSLMPRNIKAASAAASGGNQVCVFCHTPHAATNIKAPLWNRAVAGAGYTQSYIMYESSTLDAKQVQTTLNQPGGSSKLCLSCHDGTMAIGNVNVLNGQGNGTPGGQSITMTGGPNMPVGQGVDTGFTRNLGTDLSNDHPISISYNSDLVTADGELRTPDGNLVGTRGAGAKPKLPLEKTGVAAGLTAANDAQMQCATCHDPHLLETDSATVGHQKFLRLNRFQEKDPPSTTGFDSRTATAGAAQGDIICLACHDKNNDVGSWAYSAHANPSVADELYSNTAADRREFRRNIKVWQAACLNCHDTHTVYGARRLLREGTNETVASPKPGGANTAALEETCYQCHDGGTNGTLQSTTNVPNIKQDFLLTRRMPITNSAQASAASEIHDISSTVKDATTAPNTYFIDCTVSGAQCGKDFIEARSKLGVGQPSNRHAECTDCHNPHRVIRAANGLPGSLTTANTSTDTKASHNHAAGHTNIISGALRGSWGVEPVYTGTSFFDLPSDYVVKRGDPKGSTNTLASAGHVTREYQICLKCHSDYGYDDDNVLPSGTKRPELGTAGNGKTLQNPDGRTNFTRYTNQAREFQPNNAAGTTGAAAGFQTNNHRSWHPVIAATGRDLSTRSIGTSPWTSPWTNNVGTQTMYCSDCHGSGTANGTVVPTAGKPWGPHGSDNKFILKGPWGPGLGNGNSDLLCFKCHNETTYTSSSDQNHSGFCCDGRGNLHNYHRLKVGSIKCTWCHVAVPHGWKNKALLVNLNDVGKEVGRATSAEVATSSSASNFSDGPYYARAKNKILSFRPSGSWRAVDCGSGAGSGRTIIANSQGSTSNTTIQSDKVGSKSDHISWMKSTCQNPP